MPKLKDATEADVTALPPIVQSRLLDMCYLWKSTQAAGERQEKFLTFMGYARGVADGAGFSTFSVAQVVHKIYLEHYSDQPTCCRGDVRE